MIHSLSHRTTRALVSRLSLLSILALMAVSAWLTLVVRHPQPVGNPDPLAETPSLDQPAGLPGNAGTVRRFRFPDESYKTDGHGADWHMLASDGLEGDARRMVLGFLRHRMLHFTFDDGPSLDATSRILDTLSEYNLRATFFVVGKHLFGPDARPRRALLTRMKQDGHTVAVHSYSHRDLRSLSDAQIRRELSRTERMMDATLGYRPGLFRPPYGGRSQRTRALLRTRGYTEILWNIAPEEYGARTPWEIVSNFHAALNDQEGNEYGTGGIVLLHDNKVETADALPLLLEELRRRNCVLLGQAGEELWDVVGDLRYYLLYSDRLPDSLVAQRQSLARQAATRYCAEPLPEQAPVQAEQASKPRAG